MTTAQMVPAHVLHRRPWDETSLIIEAFTAQHGRIGLIARGARRSRRGRAAMLQAFQPLLLSWRGRGELPTLTQVDVAGPPMPLPAAQLPHAFYLNELLLRLLPRDDPHPELYQAYAEALSRLHLDAQSALRRFEIQLLAALGYGADLRRDHATGEAVRADACYRFEIERGPTASAPDPGSPWVVSGATLLALHEGEALDPEQRRQARRLMTWLLQHYLGGRPVKSRELIRKGPK